MLMSAFGSMKIKRHTLSVFQQPERHGHDIRIRSVEKSHMADFATLHDLNDARMIRYFSVFSSHDQSPAEEDSKAPASSVMTRASSPSE